MDAGIEGAQRSEPAPAPVSRERLRRGFVLFLLALLFALQTSNGLYVFDAKARHTSSQWLWAGISPAAGHRDVHLVHMMTGRGGTPHVFYSIGQQLLYIPFDVVLYNVLPGRDPTSRQTHTWLLVMTMFPLLVAGAFALLYLFLAEAGFSLRVAFWSSLLTLLGTSVASQTVLGLESSEELIYLAGGLYFMARDARAPSWGVKAGLAVMAMMAVMLRLPHLAYVLGIGVFGLMLRGPLAANGAAWLKRHGGWIAALGFAVVAAVVIDRLFHHARFGDWTSNYNALAERALIARDPTVRPGFFFSFPWQTGLMLELFGPSKSVFLYEPALTLGLVMLGAYRLRRGRVAGVSMPAAQRAAWIAMAVVLVPQMVFYAMYVFTFSMGHWGNRFIAAPVAVVAAMVMARVLEQMPTATGGLRAAFAAGVVVCATITMLSSFFRPDFDVIGDRMFEVVSRENTNASIQLSLLSRHPFSFHLGRRAVMVSHRVTGLPPLADARVMPEPLWRPNYWPFQVTMSRVASWLPVWALPMLPWIWAAGWLVLIAALARCAWRDTRPTTTS